MTKRRRTMAIHAVVDVGDEALYYSNKQHRDRRKEVRVDDGGVRG